MSQIQSALNIFIVLSYFLHVLILVSFQNSATPPCSASPRSHGSHYLPHPQTHLLSISDQSPSIYTGSFPRSLPDRLVCFLLALQRYPMFKLFCLISALTCLLDPGFPSACFLSDLFDTTDCLPGFDLCSSNKPELLSTPITAQVSCFWVHVCHFAHPDNLWWSLS